MLTSPQSPFSDAFASLAFVSSLIEPPSPQALSMIRGHAAPDASPAPRLLKILIPSPCRSSCSGGADGPNCSELFRARAATPVLPVVGQRVVGRRVPSCAGGHAPAPRAPEPG